MRFDGKVALISGAGSGIGRATALGFAERGAQVAVTDIDRARAEAVAAEITAAGGKAIAIAADAATIDGVETMVAGASYVTGTAVVADGGLTAQTGLPSRLPLP